MKQVRIKIHHGLKGARRSSSMDNSYKSMSVGVSNSINIGVSRSVYNVISDIGIPIKWDLKK